MNSPPRSPDDRKTMPPSPSYKWLGFDLLRETKHDYLGHVQRLHTAFGDVVRSRVVHEVIYDVHHPDLIRKLLVDNADALVRNQRAIDVFGAIHGQSVLITEGETWKRQRRMLQPSFSPKRMGEYAELMQCAIGGALQQLQAQTSPEGVCRIDFGRWAHQLTMDVILQTLFGKDCAVARDAQLRDGLIEAVATLSRIGMQELFVPWNAPDWMPHKRHKRRCKQLLDGVIREQIKTQRLRPVRPASSAEPATDLLSMLLAARDESDRGLSDDEIRDQCMTIFLAGHDTSATALTWWAWLMASHPQAMAQAHALADEVLAGQAPGYRHIERLGFVRYGLQEAMRLYPPASSLLARRTLRNVDLGDWTIPKGAMVRVTPWIIHRDARWFNEALAFRPERFDAAQAPLHRQSYMPFGTGPRSCIGSQFAMTEMTLIAAALLQRFTWCAPSMPPARFDVLLCPDKAGDLDLRLRTPWL
jgi:cytochrome P450